MNDQTPTLRWSLADTHCVWCGKPKATKAAKDRYTAEVDHPCPEGCWCDAFCWDDCLGFDEDPARIAASLRATVEAMGEVIERYAEALRGVLTSCRECRDEMPMGREGEVPTPPPADFIVWGKLSPPEALGPKCYDHAVKHLGQHMPGRADQYAVVDLRPLRRLLAEQVVLYGEVVNEEAHDG